MAESELQVEPQRAPRIVPHLEKPVERAIRLACPTIQISGTTSSALISALLCNSDSPELITRRNVVVLATDSDVEQFCSDVAFWSPERNVHRLPAADVDFDSGLYPNSRMSALRCGFFWRLLHARMEDLFVVSVGGLVQATLPQRVLLEQSFTIQVGQDLPGDVHRRFNSLGYQNSPVVEDLGQYAQRGSIIDIFSPAHPQPLRIELWGDTVESIRCFESATQRSTGEKLPSAVVIPARECLFSEDSQAHLLQSLRLHLDKPGYEDTRHSVLQQQYFPGHEFLLPYFYQSPAVPTDYLPAHSLLWVVDNVACIAEHDRLLASVRGTQDLIRPAGHQWIAPWKTVAESAVQKIVLSRLRVEDGASPGEAAAPDHIHYSTTSLVFPPASLPEKTLDFVRARLQSGDQIWISCQTENQTQRIRSLLGDLHPQVGLLASPLSESLRSPEDSLCLLRESDFLGPKKRRSNEPSSSKTAESILTFSDLKSGDLVVHKQHGVGQYEGLKLMELQGIQAEFIQIRYKNDDRLYLPVYRIGQIQKYATGGLERSLDQLGGSSWAKAQIKVKSHLRDVADELLRLYAQRAQVTRAPFKAPGSEYQRFEDLFPYSETQDQLRAVSDIVKDLTSTRPMDRIVCGDVGFGKTEVAMRAAFKAVEDGKQVAVLAPTTVLTFQHTETFRRRMSQWPLQIRSLNRFVPAKEMKQTLQDLKDGKVDIVIGTHRLLSKDVVFKSLGLLIVDEEHKFGVVHKERIKKIKLSVDTLTLSATPIPRTLNMGLVGLRDLSLINTAPVDRLPTRTFVCQYERETIRKAVLAEMQRGGQVYFIHNRIQSIYELADRLRELLPEVRTRVAHGQMDEDQLESAMLAFFNHEIDMLICTAIVESGMDVPRANTMFIDDAHTFGLSQLYQLRGRVGRAKDRAYCYLMVPPHKTLDPTAQERLKVIQENTALGSGLIIAQHDLELRGAGSILGEEQSGHVNTVGYELYMELLQEALSEAKGEPAQEDVDPEINLRIPALIPSDYMPDIRLRLAFYKRLAQIEQASDLDEIESDLRDQFGAPPPEVINLMGIMLIRRICKNLRVRDISAGPKTVSIAFLDSTPLQPQVMISMASQPDKKYAITPDSRLLVRMSEITWPAVVQELEVLVRACS